ncbi:MAG: DciA family protein [Melioribacteraceae bacterium]|nr:DciA family protein [Melioribacteraceae bacterium]
MPKEFKSLTYIMKNEKAFSKFRKSISEQDVQEEFFNIFPDLKKTVEISNIKNGILYLIVENSVLRNELYLRKTLVIDRINKHFNNNILADIKFTNFRNINRNRK